MFKIWDQSDLCTLRGVESKMIGSEGTQSARFWEAVGDVIGGPIQKIILEI